MSMPGKKIVLCFVDAGLGHVRVRSSEVVAEEEKDGEEAKGQLALTFLQGRQHSKSSHLQVQGSWDGLTHLCDPEKAEKNTPISTFTDSQHSSNQDITQMSTCYDHPYNSQNMTPTETDTCKVTQLTWSRSTNRCITQQGKLNRQYKFVLLASR